MDGTDSVQTTLTRALIEELRRRTPLPVELWDERLTSFQADQLLDAAPLSKAKKKRLRDSLAAQIVLQAYLDAHSAPDGA
jgi:putative Holliday junction resolvase